MDAVISRLAPMILPVILAGIRGFMTRSHKPRVNGKKHSFFWPKHRYYFSWPINTTQLLIKFYLYFFIVQSISGIDQIFWIKCLSSYTKNLLFIQHKVKINRAVPCLYPPLSTFSNVLIFCVMSFTALPALLWAGFPIRETIPSPDPESFLHCRPRS